MEEFEFEYCDEVIAILPVHERAKVLNLQREVKNMNELLNDPTVDRDWVKARIYTQSQLAQRIVQEGLQRHR